MKINEALKELELIVQRVKPLYDSLDDLEHADGDPELDFVRSQIMRLESSLKEIIHTNSYLKKPVDYEGKLFKNENDRYEIEGTGIELTSGSIIEFWHHNDFFDEDYWVKSSVEHADGDYYIVNYKNIDMNGLKARVR